jgi:hypothetical protein
VGKGAPATCPPSITDIVAQWWARFALPTLRRLSNELQRVGWVERSDTHHVTQLVPD